MQTLSLMKNYGWRSSTKIFEILIAVAKRTDREALVFLGKVVFLIHQR